MAVLIAPLLELMRQRLVRGRVLGVDDTTVRMQDASLPGKMRTARFWLYRGREDNPYNAFDFNQSRGRDGPAGFLSDFQGHAVGETIRRALADLKLTQKKTSIF